MINWDNLNEEERERLRQEWLRMSHEPDLSIITYGETDIPVRTPTRQDFAIMKYMAQYFDLVRAEAKKGRVGKGTKDNGWD